MEGGLIWASIIIGLFLTALAALGLALFLRRRRA